MKRNLINNITVFLISFILLSFIQVKVKNPMLIFERLFSGAGWLQIVLLSSFGVFLFNKMKNPLITTTWRKLSWTLFSIVFFAQLLLGMFVNDVFLMSGKLHLPIPAIILGGAVFKMKFSFMPILFLSTILIVGPAWCSQLCYFGAFDNLAASKKKRPQKIKHLFLYKNIILFIVVLIAILCRSFNMSSNYAAIVGGAFGVLGLLIIMFLSPRKGSMVHCTSFCPIGTLVSYLKIINPFRMYIDSKCDTCMRCSMHCRYSALTKEDIIAKKPGLTCTLCGDCIKSCQYSSIKYRLFSLPPERARNIYLIVSIAIYVVFLGVARI